MAINLSRLNISLDKFNAESSGTYNIGQMKLSSDGKSVYRTNNHKTFTILNRTEISTEEALAVKFAFCRALSREGLSQDAINAVKQKPRVEREVADDDILKAINELESGGIGTEELETGDGNAGMSTENLLSGLKRVFDALKEVKGQDLRKVLRDANMEAVVKALQQALDKVRHLDNRNTLLINNVREAFYGNPKINTDDLFKEISDILNKKRPDPAGKIVANRQNQVEADLEEPLNINAWLEENDTWPFHAENGMFPPVQGR